MEIALKSDLFERRCEFMTDTNLLWLAAKEAFCLSHCSNILATNSNEKWWFPLIPPRSAGTKPGPTFTFMAQHDPVLGFLFEPSHEITPTSKPLEKRGPQAT